MNLLDVELVVVVVKYRGFFRWYRSDRELWVLDLHKWHHVAAFYPSGIPMERYVPDGWTSEFKDFATKASENEFPASEKFWIQDGVDMLSVLNERGRKLAN